MPVNSILIKQKWPGRDGEEANREGGGSNGTHWYLARKAVVPRERVALRHNNNAGCAPQISPRVPGRSGWRTHHGRASPQRASHNMLQNAWEGGLNTEMAVQRARKGPYPGGYLLAGSAAASAKSPPRLRTAL